jgi:hypothetical protein
MNKLLFFVLAFTASAAYAQDTTPPATNNQPATQPNASASDLANRKAPTLWLTAGPGFSKVGTSSGIGDFGTDSGSRTAFTAGAEIELPLTSFVSIQFGVDYLQKGLDFNSPSANTSGNINLNYFEVPLLLRFNVPIGANTLSLMGGPYGSLAASRTEISGSAPSADVGDAFKAWDWGVRFGAAFEIPVTEHFDFTIGADYDLGIMDLNSNSTSTSDSAVRNRSLIAAIGLGFRI